MDNAFAITMGFLTFWCLGVLIGGEHVTLSRLQKLQQLRRTFRTRPRDDDNWNYTATRDQIPSMISSETTILNLATLPLIIEKSDNYSIDAKSPNSFKIRHYSDIYRSRNHLSYGLNAIQRLKELISRDKPRLARISSYDEEAFRRAESNWKTGEVPCKIPKPTVVKVREFHPSATIQYDPECTVLHRCSDSTGCCRPGEHCTAKTTEDVLVYFFAIRQDMRIPFVKALSFQNHTSCTCKRKTHATSAAIKRRSRADQWDSSESHQENHHQHHPKRCRKCPLPFTSRMYKDGRHSCDCFDRQKQCLRIKRGNMALTETQLRCIETHHCDIPDCEYGAFDLSTGFCPRKQDRAIHRKRNRTLNRRARLHRRWTLIEQE